MLTMGLDTYYLKKYTHPVLHSHLMDPQFPHQ